MFSRVTFINVCLVLFFVALMSALYLSLQQSSSKHVTLLKYSIPSVFIGYLLWYFINLKNPAIVNTFFWLFIFILVALLFFACSNYFNQHNVFFFEGVFVNLGCLCMGILALYMLFSLVNEGIIKRDVPVAIILILIVACCIGLFQLNKKK